MEHSRPKLPPLISPGGEAPRRKKKKRLPQPRALDDEEVPPTLERISDDDVTADRPTRKRKPRHRPPPPQPDRTPRSDDDVADVRREAERETDNRRRIHIRKNVDQDHDEKALEPDSDHRPPAQERMKKKKRKKNHDGMEMTRPTPDSEDEFYPSEFEVAEEDIVEIGAVEDKTQDIPLPSYHASIVPSQATNEMFLETKSGFISEKKSELAKAREAQLREPVVVEEEEGETIQFAVRVAKFMHTMGLIIQGMLAGIALWHLVSVYILKNISDYALLQYYETLALPVQCMFYVALVICMISSSDKCDLASPQGGFSRAIITFQTGTITALVYFLALILSLCMAATDDEMGLYSESPDVWLNGYYADSDGTLKTSVATPSLRPAMVSKLATWIVLTVTRAVCIILCWLINANDPETNDTIEHLKLMGDSGDQNQHQHEHWATKTNSPV